HNLKNIDCHIPRNSLTVITGLSGSGKSSLAFDTIYAEGQRRYLESLSSYARQFLGDLKKPDVESIEGLSPSVAIDQKTVSHNPRSTVGTVTEIYDYLRLLYAHIGIPHCPSCGRQLSRMSVDEIVDILYSEMPLESRIVIYAPVAREKRGEYKKEIARFRKKGYSKILIDGDLFDLEENIALEKNIRHTILLMIDRLKLEKDRDHMQRLADSIELALKEGSGFVEIKNHDTKESQVFSEDFICPTCGISIPEITPKIFSFNTPYGACPDCTGLGYKMEISPDLMVDKEKSLNEGAIGMFKDGYMFDLLIKVCKAYGGDANTPFKELPQRCQDALIFGSDKKIKRRYEFESGHYETSKEFEGIYNNIQRRYHQTSSSGIRDWIENKFMQKQPCDTCHGHKLRPEALAVIVNGFNISELTELPIEKAYEFINTLPLSAWEVKIAQEVIKEVTRRIQFLIDVGLEYLTLARRASTLSGGESQRIRLATQIGSRLQGVLYVLDEPTIGLHQRDNSRLIKTLTELRDVGNTIVVVEHDEQVIRNSDYLVDLGPAAGVHGGEIVFQGEVEAIYKYQEGVSQTADFLTGKKSIPMKVTHRKPSPDRIVLKGARQNNLKNLTVEFPLGVLICVTGVSGSGKSSLINETLYPLMKNRIYRTHDEVGKHEGIQGIEKVDKVIELSQSPIGRTPRSNPATYTKVFDEIRDLFARTPEARSRGYQKSRFSFNVKGGRCESCSGHGQVKIEMQFLPDVYVDCDVCKGKRFNRETLEVKYRGKSISDILEMTIDEARDFFKNINKIRETLQILQDVGLGYIKLGQPATTLSGGEAQRIKIASELRKRATGSTIYILDEPTTGLHFEDVRRLMEILDRLVERGNTVIVIEHNLDIIKNADWIIDLGPEGGDKGGNLVFTGPTGELITHEKSYTGKYLKAYYTRT
ncbi:MAG: excinuclease ABC subunit UvrA, partial [Thermotogota bacterium]